METIKHLLARIVFALSLACLAAAAQDAGRWYIKADAGGNWMNDSDVKEFLAAVPDGAQVTFKPGLRLGLGGGYRVADWCALEAETGLLGNEIDSISGASYVDAVFAQIPLLLNVRLEMAGQSGLTPYVGAGVGGSLALLSVQQIDYWPYTVSGDDADFVFAWQAFAGMRYALNDSMALGLEYRFFAAESPTWDSGANPAAGNMSFGNTETHAVSVTFNYRF